MNRHNIAVAVFCLLEIRKKVFFERVDEARNKLKNMKTINITLIIIAYLGIAWFGSLMADNFTRLEQINSKLEITNYTLKIIACDDNFSQIEPQTTKDCDALK